MIPDITTLWVVFFLLLCTFLLNTLIFQPILKVIDARTTAVRGARELAESASSKAAAAAAEYDTKLNAARTDVYRQIDETRRAAMDKRSELIAATRQTVERETQSATALVSQESAAARAALDRDAADLANAILTRVLDRAS
jgi:F-type H+-transporting ATPase subunit b